MFLSPKPQTRRKAGKKPKQPKEETADAPAAEE